MDSLGPGVLSEALWQVFENSGITAVLCYGKTEVPAETEKKAIISKLHDSLIEGHKGFQQTYNKIRERYIWKGIRNEIQNFIRTLVNVKRKKYIVR